VGVVSPRYQIERLPSPPVCYWPMVMDPWEDKNRGCTIRVIVWLWFYITLWTSTL